MSELQAASPPLMRRESPHRRPSGGGGGHHKSKTLMNQLFSSFSSTEDSSPRSRVPTLPPSPPDSMRGSPDPKHRHAKSTWGGVPTLLSFTGNGTDDSDSGTGGGSGGGGNCGSSCQSFLSLSAITSTLSADSFATAPRSPPTPVAVSPNSGKINEATVSGSGGGVDWDGRPVVYFDVAVSTEGGATWMVRKTLRQFYVLKVGIGSRYADVCNLVFPVLPPQRRPTPALPRPNLLRRRFLWACSLLAGGSGSNDSGGGSDGTDNDAFAPSVAALAVGSALNELLGMMLALPPPASDFMAAFLAGPGSKAGRYRCAAGGAGSPPPAAFARLAGVAEGHEKAATALDGGMAATATAAGAAGPAPRSAVPAPVTPAFAAWLMLIGAAQATRLAWSGGEAALLLPAAIATMVFLVIVLLSPPEAAATAANGRAQRTGRALVAVAAASELIVPFVTWGPVGGLWTHIGCVFLLGAVGPCLPVLAVANAAFLVLALRRLLSAASGGGGASLFGRFLHNQPRRAAAAAAARRGGSGGGILLGGGGGGGGAGSFLSHLGTSPAMWLPLVLLVGVAVSCLLSGAGRSRSGRDGIAADTAMAVAEGSECDADGPGEVSCSSGGSAAAVTRGRPQL